MPSEEKLVVVRDSVSKAGLLLLRISLRDGGSFPTQEPVLLKATLIYSGDHRQSLFYFLDSFYHPMTSLRAINTIEDPKEKSPSQKI